MYIFCGVGGAIIFKYGFGMFYVFLGGCLEVWEEVLVKEVSGIYWYLGWGRIYKGLVGEDGLFVLVNWGR